MLDGFLNRKKENRSGRQEKLSAYLDGELSARQRIKLEKELTQDPALRRELEELRRTSRMLRSLPTLAVPRSFTLDPAVYGRVKPRRLYLYPVMRAATVVAMLVFAFLFVGDLPIRRLSPMPASAPNAEMVAMEKEVVGTAQPQMMVEGESADESAIETLAEPIVEEVEERQFEEVVETVVETVLEEMAVEAEAELAPMTEMPATEPAETDATEPPIGVPAEGGVSAGGEVPPATATPGPAPTLSPTEAASKVIVPTVFPTQEMAPSDPPTELVPLPSEGEAADTVPAEEGLPIPAEAVPVKELDRGEDETIINRIDWGLIGKLGAGILAAGLLIITLLARRFNW